MLIRYSAAPILLRGLGYVAGSRIDRPPPSPARYPGNSACAEFYPLIFGANLEALLRFDGFVLMRCGVGIRSLLAITTAFPHPQASRCAARMGWLCMARLGPVGAAYPADAHRH